MHVKRLLILAVLLAVLVVAVKLFKSPPAPTQLAKEVGFESLVPESLSAEAIQGLDLYQGDQADNAIQLRRRDDSWVAASYHDAPVKADKVTKLLSSVGSLEGELRSEQKDFLGDFRLEDGQALHLLLYTTDAEKPAVHLLAGKSSGRSGFMRTADNTRVYSVNLNLRSEAGLYGDDAEKAPEAKPWLDLQLHDIPEDQVTMVELYQPDRTFRLKQEKPEPAAEETTSSGDKDKKEDAQPAAKPKADPKWVLAEPKVTYDLKQAAAKGLVSTLRTLRGDDVVSPDKIADYGLEAPVHRAVLTVEEEGKEGRQVTIAVGKEVPEQDGKRYLRLGQEGPVYVLPKWSFTQVFPTLGTLVSLDVLRVNPEEVTRIAWRQEGQEWTLERQAEAAEKTSGEAADGQAKPGASAWRLMQAADQPVAADQVTSLLNLTKALTADDWFPTPPASAQLDQPAVSLDLTLSDQTRHQVTVGQGVGAEESRYVARAGAEGAFVIPKATYTAVIEALKALQPKAPDTSEAPASSPSASEAPTSETPASSSSQ